MEQFGQKFPNVLRSLPDTGWLAEQPSEFQARMATAGRWTIVPRGGQVYTVGDVPNAIYGLGEGLLDISIPVAGDEEVTIHRAGPGFWVGESALLAETTRMITLTAATQCRVFRIPVGAVRRVLAKHPEYWRCFMRLSLMNATLAARVLAESLSLPSRVRFARALLRQVNPDGSVWATQEELARMIGMSRTAFRRALRELIDAGALQTEYGGLRIIDRAAIERAAEAG